MTTNEVTETLNKILKYIPDFALSGGIIISNYLIEHKVPLISQSINDLDLAVLDLKSITEEINVDFLISHYHPKNNKGKFHLMLVDKKTRMRIDIFPMGQKVKTRLQTIKIGARNYPALCLEDMICRLQLICNDILEEKNIDPKFFINLLLMHPYCDHQKLNAIWAEHYKTGGFDQIFAKIVAVAKTKPYLLKKIIYSKNLNFVCSKCIKVPDFPLATNQAIFDLLGYI